MALTLPVSEPEVDWVRDLVNEEVMEEDGEKESVAEVESVPTPFAPPQLPLVDTLPVPERVKVGVGEVQGLGECVPVTLPHPLPLPLLVAEEVAREVRVMVIEVEGQGVIVEVPVPPCFPTPTLVTEPLGD